MWANCIPKDKWHVFRDCFPSLSLGVVCSLLFFTEIQRRTTCDTLLSLSVSSKQQQNKKREKRSKIKIDLLKRKEKHRRNSSKLWRWTSQSVVFGACIRKMDEWKMYTFSPVILLVKCIKLNVSICLLARYDENVRVRDFFFVVRCAFSCLVAIQFSPFAIFHVFHVRSQVFFFYW